MHVLITVEENYQSDELELLLLSQELNELLSQGSKLLDESFEPESIEAECW